MRTVARLSLHFNLDFVTCAHNCVCLWVLIVRNKTLYSRPPNQPSLTHSFLSKNLPTPWLTRLTKSSVFSSQLLLEAWVAWSPAGAISCPPSWLSSRHYLTALAFLALYCWPLCHSSTIEMCCCSSFLHAAVSTDSLALIWRVRYTSLCSINIGPLYMLMSAGSELYVAHKAKRVLDKARKVGQTWRELKKEMCAVFIPVISRGFIPCLNYLNI